MKVISEIKKDVCVSTMNDGDIAVITKWRDLEQFVGTVVMRYKNSLIKIGFPSSAGWSNLFDNYKDFDNLRVIILPKGTQLEV
jgi:hypothetical protein